jgi:hypothetical protein
MLAFLITHPVCVVLKACTVKQFEMNFINRRGTKLVNGTTLETMQWYRRFSCRTVTAEFRFQTQANPHLIYGAGTGFAPSILVFPFHHNSTKATCSLIWGLTASLNNIL